MSQLPNLAEKRSLRSKLGQPFSKPRRWSFTAKILAAGTVTLALTTLAHAYYQQQVGNFHTVIEGELYRSSQPSAADIAHYQQTYGIRTILNLRDEKKGQWYQEEEKASAEHGVQLVNYPIDSDRGLTVSEAEELARLMMSLPKPILIHCEHGSNRTGLASAIYLDAVRKENDLTAAMQLSPYYGHFAIPVVGKYNISRSYWKFAQQSQL